MYHYRPLVLRGHSTQFKNYVARKVVTKAMSGRRIRETFTSIAPGDLTRWCSSYRQYGFVF